MVHHHGVTLGVEGQGLAQLVARAPNQRRRRWEPVGGQEARPPIDYDHAETDLGGKAHQRPSIVARAQYHQLGWRNQHIEEHRPAGDLVDSGHCRTEQLARLGQRTGGQVR